ncbi:cystatin-like protein [Pseudorasbora parva]|uniref:cystatin-like protein n=1 Tax=Pseudorasbora parva TaxID=51549 RepID=UPI00351F252A
MRGLLLLLSALVLLESTDGNQQYDQLSQHDREIIDRAIEKANKEHGHAKHLDFVSIPDVNPDKQMLHVLLKPTSCDKMTKSVHQKDCVIQNNKPQVYCVECRRSMSCFPLKYTEKIKQTISECLNPSSGTHHAGATTLFSHKSEDHPRTGCLGCI